MLRGFALGYELIFVDDGSVDGTAGLLAAIQDSDPEHVRVAFLRRNCGQTAALSAALDLSRGAILVPMDGDRQNDPADIPRLLAKLDEGYDVVSGWRRKRQDTLLTRKVPSWIANRLVARISGVAAPRLRLHDEGVSPAGPRRGPALRRDAPIHPDLRHLAGGARSPSWRSTTAPGPPGKTKYGLGRTFNVVLDLILIRFFQRYAQRPIHLFGRIGLWSILLSFVSFAAMLYFKYVFPWPTGLGCRPRRSSRRPCRSLTVMFFLGGVQSILMGVLAEMVMRTYYESQSKTTYLAGRGPPAPDLDRRGRQRDLDRVVYRSPDHPGDLRESQ